ncbi:MAG: hypothetical protein JWP29_5501, partial [Rhodoferax sp.]|nr:hypothetical protein [Rhodoferax sp.]
IPKTAATGSWRIDGLPQTNYRNYGSFKVEEYKRPTIELSMEKQKKMLMPGEPFEIKIKLRSFSGADLGNIPINYVISRNGRIPSNNSRPNDYSSDYIKIRLKQQTGYTDEKGELSIPVSDSVVAKAVLNDSLVWNYNYNLNATAVDATGESTELNETLNISSRPVKINIPVNKTYDRQVLPVLNVSTSADFEGVVGRKINIRLYKINNPKLNESNIKYVDQWYYNESDWNTWFPDKAVHARVKEEKTLVLDTVINTAAYEKFALRKEDIKAGFFQLLAECKDNGRIIGQASYTFDVFDSKTGDVPVDNIDYLPFNSAKANDALTWYSSGKNDSYTIYQVLYMGGKKKRIIRNIYQPVTERAGIQVWKYQVPSDATGELILNRITVRDNKIDKHEKRIYINAVSTQSPDIIVEKYRKVMAPGAQETFTLSVKTKSDNIAAEIMTTLYDASLDKLEKHHWNLPNTNPYPYYFNTGWNYSLTSTQKAGNYSESSTMVNLQEIRMSKRGADMFYAVEGRAAGLSIGNASGLQEVVVGYGIERRSNMTGSVSTIMIRGTSSLNDYNQPMIVINGQVYSGELSSINPNAITQIMVLKGADASAIYGARAAQGVLIISTRGPIVLPGSEEPVVKVRKNFNETAFFFPQIHAGADGYYSFSFTMPETATEWNWKMLAHTRKAQFTYLEKKLQTQLNLMVQPNMPRLLYQGDKIKLQSRISNLDTLTIQGKATCKIEDAVTGEDITYRLTDNNSQTFNLSKKSSGAVSFLLHVPAEQSNPLKIVITAASAGAADAEEHIVPILSSRVFIRQSQQVHFANQSTITMPAVKMPANASLYGVGISIAQKPQASLIYALPWLANYSYDCAEQTFNKLRAQVTALRLMQ